MTERKLIIWGAGKLGSIAYHYYKNLYSSIVFVDKDNLKWNESVNGISVCNPEEVSFLNCDVVIASRHNVGPILSELKNRKGIERISSFDVKLEIPADVCLSGHNISRGEVFSSVYFSGGLGNQLFQYAFYKNLEEKGRRNYANISKCLVSGTRGFALSNVFSGIRMQTITNEEEEMLLRGIRTSYSTEKFVIYHEKEERGTEKRADETLIDADGGIFEGFFQTCVWAERVRTSLLNDLVFDYRANKKLEELVRNLESDNSSVSIHFRRGDYLEKRNSYLYGGICTDDYYKEAIKYIQTQVESPNFYVFSDDIDFVRANYDIPNCRYIERKLFEEYEDWYDMCLMSKCKHNIIANSTFSWWGAWLNTYDHKIVVAPARWINIFTYTDIYPASWNTISVD